MKVKEIIEVIKIAECGEEDSNIFNKFKKCISEDDSHRIYGMKLLHSLNYPSGDIFTLYIGEFSDLANINYPTVTFMNGNLEWWANGCFMIEEINDENDPEYGMEDISIFDDSNFEPFIDE